MRTLLFSDFNPASLVALYLQVFPERVVEPKYAAMSSSFMPSPVIVKRHLNYTTGQFIDAGREVALWKGDHWEVLGAPSRAAASPGRFLRAAALLATLLADHSVFWSAETGFMPRPGALGLTQPQYDLAWKTATGYGRLVVGQTLAYDAGHWAYRFDTLDQDASGNPHPRGIFHLVNFRPEVWR